jgi:hypothetical protein
MEMGARKPDKVFSAYNYTIKQGCLVPANTWIADHRVRSKNFKWILLKRGVVGPSPSGVANGEKGGPFEASPETF